MSNPESSLPPGFRFHPTDEELILHYLRNKASSVPCPVSIIAEVDIYKFDPWDLPGKAMFGEKEWYFFTPRDRKYPNGVRPNRAAVSGYWKATGTDKPIVATDGDSKVIGVKKALVFYKGKPPKGLKSNWIMHEYRLAQTPNLKPIRPKESSMRLDEWVLCRIYKKSTAMDREQESPVTQEASPSHFQNQNMLNQQQKSLYLSDYFLEDYSDLIGFEQNPINTNDIHSNNGNNYLLQKHHHTDPINPILGVENQLKRARPMSMNTEETMLHPLKKVLNSYNFNTNTSQLDIPQYNYFVNQQLLNQQMLLSSHYQL